MRVPGAFSRFDEHRDCVCFDGRAQDTVSLSRKAIHQKRNSKLISFSDFLMLPAERALTEERAAG
jgi:hypothetical protein